MQSTTSRDPFPNLEGLPKAVVGLLLRGKVNNKFLLNTGWCGLMHSSVCRGRKLKNAFEGFIKTALLLVPDVQGDDLDRIVRRPDAVGRPFHPLPYNIGIDGGVK